MDYGRKWSDDHGFDIIKEIAQKITSKHNQEDSMLIVGNRGSGKSWGAITVAYSVAKEVAEIKGGTWEKYFSFENIAIITKEEVIRVIKCRLGQYCVVILDDIGVGWSNRDFATKFNKVMNNIYQTFRTRNVFLIMTVPDKDYIDKLPRNMIHYFCEVDQSHFNDGFIVIKVKKSKKTPHMPHPIYPFVTKHGVRYPRHIVFTGPKSLTDSYELSRRRIEKESADKGLAELEALEMDSETNPATKKTDLLRPGVFALHEQNKYTQKQIGQMMGCSQQLVSEIVTGVK